MPANRIAFALLATTCLLASVQAANANRFDGRYTVVLTTEVGKCEPAIPGAFAVKADDITADASSPLKADGAVEPNGNMWVRFSAGEDQYRAQGRLTAGGGSGAWSSGTRYCGGKWRATRAR
jgi:hypothetical protein